MRLTEDNFMLYAARHYDEQRITSSDEFNEDIKRFQYLKRLLKRYNNSGDLRVRLILNHFIVLYNCFGVHATNMLFLKLSEFHSTIKPFIVHLSFMPDTIEYSETTLKNEAIDMDLKILEELRKL